MKNLVDIYPSLTPHQKAWILIGPKYHGWSFKDVCDHVRESAGEDIDPTSIREHLENNHVFLVDSPPSRKHRPPNSQPSSKQKIDKQLARDARKAEAEGQFDPSNIKEGREWVQRRINLRRGQPEFRMKLLEAYGRRCAVTECDCPDALEAAHILPYCGKDTNHIQNGILLRSDIHALFDLGMIGFDPVTRKVIVSKSLKGTVYEKLKKRKLRIPLESKNRPNPEVLGRHLEGWELK
jgi:hypothetical protein